jgi:hypothetical protein
MPTDDLDPRVRGSLFQFLGVGLALLLGAGLAIALESGAPLGEALLGLAQRGVAPGVTALLYRSRAMWARWLDAYLERGAELRARRQAIRRVEEERDQAWLRLARLEQSLHPLLDQLSVAVGKPVLPAQAAPLLHEILAAWRQALDDARTAQAQAETFSGLADERRLQIEQLTRERNTL